VELNLAGYRQVLVSVTASIEPGGRTAHVGDVRAQVALTLQVVEDLLASRGMTFAEVSRATAYFKSPGDAPVFDEWIARQELGAMPVVRTACDICRTDLLFEIELDSVRVDN
jgi:enamine deaminase RidA (YjgF/YER057c/UK114 family)